LSAVAHHREIDFLRHIDPLLTDESIWVRVALARALGDRKDEAVRTLLLGMLKDRVGAVQIAAMEAMGRFRDRRFNEPIFELTTSPDPDVVKSAIAVLGEIGDPTIAPRIRVFLNHANWGIRAAAAQSLGRLGDSTARTFLENLATHDPDPLVQHTAQLALAQFTTKP
jgi:HEAT repeat protein